MKKIFKWFCVLALSGFYMGQVWAEDNWLVRGRILWVNPNDDSGAVTGLPGSGVGVDGDTTLELDFTRMFRKQWGVEVIFGTSKHDLAGEGTIAGLGKIGEIRTLPLTATLQYHLSPASEVRPYLGIGVNYTRFYDEKTSDSLQGALGPTALELDDSLGLAAQFGVDVAVNEDWFVNFDAKYIQMDTTATLNSGGTIRKVDVDINPWFFGVGVGTSF